MTRLLKTLSITALISITAACTSLGHKFDSSKIDTLKPGVTTKQEAIDALGKPYKRQQGTLAENEGKERIFWQYTNTNNFTLSTSGEVVVIDFNKDQTMDKIVKRAQVIK